MAHIGYEDGNIRIVPDPGKLVTIGSDKGTTNYFKFASDGEAGMVGTARTTTSPWVTAEAIGVPGTSAATLTTLGIGTVYQFADNLERYVRCTFKIPDDADMTADFAVLLGWSSPTVSQDCDWEVAFLLRQVGEDMSAAADDTLQGYKESAATANGLVISTFTIDNGTYINASDVCVTLSIMRDGNDGSDNLGDVANLHGVCLQYYVNKLGTAT